jgi:hypothetical protein
MLPIAVFWRDGKEIVSPEKVVPGRPSLRT